MNMDTDIRATQNILLPPDPERIMEGLRDTGYNFNTSIADIVDNSIAADADKIDITIDFIGIDRKSTRLNSSHL